MVVFGKILFEVLCLCFWEMVFREFSVEIIEKVFGADVVMFGRTCRGIHLGGSSEVCGGGRLRE